MIKDFSTLMSSIDFQDQEVNFCHIDSIDVYTADDDPKLTACMNIKSKGSNLVVETGKSKDSYVLGRIRGEVCVNVFLKTEGENFDLRGPDLMLSIYHHKGTIYAKLTGI